jgi:type IV pilus assembly protein PilQ
MKKAHGLMRGLFSGLALCLTLVAPSTFAASNAIDNVEYSQLTDQVLVKVIFRQPLAVAPSSFTVSAPPRVAYDFPDTENAFGKSALNVNLGPLRSLNIAQGDTRTRLVLNLSSTNQVDSRIEGNTLYLSLPKMGLVAAATPSAASAVIPPSTRPNAYETSSSINNLDFRAESMELATVKIDLSEPNVIVDARQRPDGVQLVLPNSIANEKLLKRLDVRDYGTPVEAISVANVGRGSQVTFTNRGDWDYNVRQLDTQLVVEFRRTTRDPNSLTGSKDLQGKVVSFNFTQPVPVSQMIGIFQDITGLNFMVMPGVSGEIQSLKMENTPVDEAITVISRMYNLGFRRYGSIVIVGRTDDLVKYDKDEKERAAAMASVEPIQQETFKIKYRTASEVANLLIRNGVTAQQSAPGTTTPIASQQPGGNFPQGGSLAGQQRSLISDRGMLSIDDATNTIYVEETKTQLAKIRERIQALDRPAKQVMIEARIVETSNTFFSSLGVKIGSGSLVQYQIGGTKSNLSFSSAASSVNLPANTGTLNFSLFNAAKTRIINLELDAAEGDSKVKQLANPKVMTRDTKNAKIKFGTKIAGYSQATAGQTPSVTYTDAVTLLDVKPQVQVDGKIQMDLTVKNDSPAGSTGNINNREITTSVIIENGGTIVIGGMYAQTDTNGTDRVPFLGDLPYVGWLFKQQLTKKEQSELLVFITPRIVSEELTLQ